MYKKDTGSWQLADQYRFFGLLSIRRISIRRIPIIGLGLGIAFGELKFGELKRNRFFAA